jgi:arylsulfatase
VGRFKAHFFTQSGYAGDAPVPHDPPLVFDLQADPSERFDVAARHPEAIERIRERVKAHRATVEPVTDQLSLLIKD